MEFTKLSNRLDLVASFVPAGARLLDVGSDHAYLPIALLQEGKIEAAIAGEVVEGPYQSALQNVADNGLEDKIEVRLANGLAAFEPTDCISVRLGRLALRSMPYACQSVHHISDISDLAFPIGKAGT